MKEFIGYLLGPWSLPAFGAAGVFAFFGGFLVFLTHIATRDKDSLRTPQAWSWSFFWQENFVRVVSWPVLTYLALRFIQSALFLIKINTENMLFATFVGSLSDFLFIVFHLIRKFIINKTQRVIQALDQPDNINPPK